MSFIAVLTNETITETWSVSHKSDAWASVEADGGSIIRKLGGFSGAEQQATVLCSSDGSATKYHVGTWVTDVGSPDEIVLAASTSFGIHAIRGYETAGQLNANVYVKISVVTESGGVLTYDRTLIDWSPIKEGAVPVELGLNIANAGTMGGASSVGITTYPQLVSGTTLLVGERIAVEVGIDTPGRNGEQMAIEFGSQPCNSNSGTLTIGESGTGVFGSAIIMPMNFSEGNQDVWGLHSEISIPWFSGTNLIPWADIGTDWSSAKWVTNAAARYLTRGNGEVVSQFWAFQDDAYLYVAMNNIIDSCIQPSDHQELYFCFGGDWKDSLTPDIDDLIFRRDITSGTSANRAPVLPVAAADGNDGGEYILQGDGVTSYPANLEVPSYNAGTFTFASNSKTMVEGTDFRMGGPGATSTAPNPGGNPSGAYSEFKIAKAKLGNWNGLTPIGVIVMYQCDVQASGVSTYPSELAARSDKNDWPWSGNYYTSDAVKVTASAKVSADEIDLRPLMGAHMHSEGAPVAAARRIFIC